MRHDQHCCRSAHLFHLYVVLHASQATRDIKRSRFDFRFCPVKHFEEICCLRSHARVDVSFRAFNVVVKIISKQMDKVNCVIPHLFVSVSGEEYKCNVSNIFSGQCTFFSYTCRRIPGEEDLWSISTCTPTFSEFLQEY